MLATLKPERLQPELCLSMTSFHVAGAGRGFNSGADSLCLRSSWLSFRALGGLKLIGFMD